MLVKLDNVSSKVTFGKVKTTDFSANAVWGQCEKNASYQLSPNDVVCLWSIRYPPS